MIANVRLRNRSRIDEHSLVQNRKLSYFLATKAIGHPDGPVNVSLEEVRAALGYDDWSRLSEDEQAQFKNMVLNAYDQLEAMGAKSKVKIVEKQ